MSILKVYHYLLRLLLRNQDTMALTGEDHLQEAVTDVVEIKEVLTEEVEKNIRKIQWVPEKDNCLVKILKPDGKIIEGFAELSIKSLPISTVLQFERYGFVKIKENRRDYVYCYFSH